MKLPHQDGFPHRQAIVIWIATLCVLVGAGWPGQAPATRLSDIGIALLSFALCYGFTRLIFAALAMLMQDQLGNIARWCMVIVFYGGILATVSGLLTAPFQWHDVHQGASSPAILAALPSGLFTAAAALKTLEKHDLEIEQSF